MRPVSSAAFRFPRFPDLHSLGKRSVIFPAALLAATGIGMQTLGIVFFARDRFGASATQIGCLAATWSLCYIFGCVFLRGLSSRVPPRLSILAAMWAMLIAIACLGASGSLAFAFLCYGVFGVATSFFWPPMMGWLSMGMEGRELGRAMGIFNVCWSTGAVVGPTFAGYLSEVDTRLPIYASTLAYLAAAIWITVGAVALPGVRGEPHSRAEASALRVGRDGTWLRYPSWAGLFAAYVVFGVVLNVFPLSAPEAFGISKSTIGILFLARGLATTVALAVLGRSSWWHFRGWQLAAGHGVFALTMVLMALSSSVYTACLLLIAIGILIGHSYSNSLFHGVAGSRSRAPRMAVHEGLLSAGLVFGSACGGAVFDLWGVESVYLSCSGVLFVVAMAETVLFAAARRNGTGREIVSSGR
jgi:predicted MFS family arabinose efflux permease